MNATAAGAEQRLARLALQAYDVSRQAELTPIRLLNNAVFRVDDGAGAQLVLRIHRPEYRDVAHIRSELEFLTFVCDQVEGTHVRVPRPVVPRSGDVVVEVEGRQCTLLTWVEGRVLRVGRGLGPRAVHELGRALAQLHDAAERFRPSPGFDVPTWDADSMFTEASPYRPGPFEEVLSREDLALFREVEERTQATFDLLERDGHPLRVIHSDFVLVNCHLARRREGWEVGVLDFDDLGWGYLLYDLCPLLGNLADFPGSYRRLRRAFLDGYRSVRSLPTQLEVHVPVLMAARHAEVCVWLFGLHRTTGAGPPIAEHVAYRMEAIRRCLALSSEPGITPAPPRA
jgi:Ser/Thr protein kinase RdoA (MazF antagonist)